MPIGRTQIVSPGARNTVLTWESEERSINNGCGFSSHDSRVVCVQFEHDTIPGSDGIMIATNALVDKYAILSWSAGDASSLTAEVDLINGMFVSMPMNQLSIDIVYALPTSTAVGPDIRASVILGRGSKGPPFQARRTKYVGDLVGAESAAITIPKHAHSVFFSSATYGTPTARIKQIASDLSVINDSDVGKTISSAVPICQTASAITLTGTGTLIKVVFLLAL